MEVKRDESIHRATRVVVDTGLVPHRVVLRYVPDSVQPWVTHFEAMKVADEDTLVHAYWFQGHYFDTKEDALEDFNERASKL
jgi:hypothetical protein